MWITPIPPSLAIAMASLDSVTVSMAALAKGRLRSIFCVTFVDTSTSLGSTSEYPGTRSMSSNVKADLPNFSLNSMVKSSF